MKDIPPSTEPVRHLGLNQFESPLVPLRDEAGALFLDHSQDILLDDTAAAVDPLPRHRTVLELAGPRNPIFFDPARTTAAIVSCGGICPGINDVIRGLVMTLHYTYGVKSVLGIRYGYQGLVEGCEHPPVPLTPESVSDIQNRGGSVLGCSRGPQDPRKMVDQLAALSVGILFVIGGDGTLRAAQGIVTEIDRRLLPIAVVGIPKTIDNDLTGIDESFGFESAFAEAVKAIRCAHDEAKGNPRGIGLVKLMGRESGFIAASAALAENCVNFVLIPEVPFDLYGEHGFLACLERRLERRGHAVIVVAEGTQCQAPDAGPPRADASGNPKHADIGLHLKGKIEEFFTAIRRPVNLKYIDPSYTIRSVPATPQDQLFCLRLAQSAVHAAMAGRTGMVVARWHGRFVHLPLRAVTFKRRRIEPDSDFWLAVLDATGQPFSFREKRPAPKAEASQAVRSSE